MNTFGMMQTATPRPSTPYKETPKRLLSQAPARTHTWERRPRTEPRHDSSRHAPHRVQLADE